MKAVNTPVQNQVGRVVDRDRGLVVTIGKTLPDREHENGKEHYRRDHDHESGKQIDHENDAERRLPAADLHDEWSLVVDDDEEHDADRKNCRERDDGDDPLGSGATTKSEGGRGGNKGHQHEEGHESGHGTCSSNSVSLVTSDSSL